MPQLCIRLHHQCSCGYPSGGGCPIPQSRASHASAYNASSSKNHPPAFPDGTSSPHQGKLLKAPRGTNTMADWGNRIKLLACCGFVCDSTPAGKENAAIYLPHVHSAAGEAK
mmetsp:Transcript_37993/g.95521  ORF Transcript_37993/g.95521 Transcript_37993/m.95521 type:complete len:112 (-) Transcript_37993:390-725(-)